MHLLNMVSASKSSCLQNVTPPPPSHLSHKGSFYARSGLGFFFVFYLVFALTACNSGGGGSSSNDGNNSSSGSLRLSFSSYNDTENTVVGMREFLLTVNASGLEQTQDVSFIVSESEKAQDWSEELSAHPAIITRVFSPSLDKREVYFSATDKLPLKSPLFPESADATNDIVVVDLSQDGKSENEYTKEQIPGVMLPSTGYYVHAYADETHVKSSELVTTVAGYPDPFPAQFNSETPESDTGFHSVEQFYWSMGMWKAGGQFVDVTHDSFFLLREIEIKRGEFALLPLRYISPFDGEDNNAPNVCPLSVFPINQIPVRTVRTSDSSDRPFMQLHFLTSISARGTLERGVSGLVLNNPVATIPALKRNEILDMLIEANYLIKRQLIRDHAEEQDYLENGYITTLDIVITCTTSSGLYALRDRLIPRYKVIDE